MSSSEQMVLMLFSLACVAAILLVGLAGALVRLGFSKRRQEEERDRFFDLSLDILCISSADGFFKRVNPAFTQILGWSRDELLTRPYIDFVHPDDIAATKDAVERQTVAGEKILFFDNRYRRKDGSWRVLAWRSVPYPGGFMYATARDVTEIRQMAAALRSSEESLSVTLDSEELERRVEDRTSALRDSERLAQAALDALSAHVAILDERGVIIATNQPWREFATCNGLFSGEADVGTNYLDVCDRCADTEGSAAQMAQAVREIIAGKIQRFSTEYACHSKSEQRWFLGRVTRSPGTGAVRVVVSHENITQIKLRERQNLRAQRLESIGTLAGGVAHDLNNALAPVMMSLELLKEQYPRETELLDTLDASAKRGAEMVRQLLTFAKGAEGDHVLVEMEFLLREMQKIIRGTFPKNILLEVRCDPRLPKVRGDVTQLHQILLNLAVNARDAMPEGGTLTLEARCGEPDDAVSRDFPDARQGPFVLVRVSDTGTGIPPELVDRIFDPFFTTKAPDVGTGLGLSTVMGIVKGHRGFLTVETHLGQGTSFNVYLPAEYGESKAGASLEGEPVFRGKGEAILFVDDEIALRNVARAVLKKLGFEAVLAADGTEGLMRVAERWTDLRAVITDVHMPRMDGVAFVMALRRILPIIPVAVMSGRQDEAAKKVFSEMGVRAWLDKPFGEAQLADMLRCLLATE